MAATIYPNKEQGNLYGSRDIFTGIKVARLRWAGLVQRVNSNEMVRE